MTPFATAWLLEMMRSYSDKSNCSMANGINANLARRWVLDVERRGHAGTPDQVGRNVVAKGFVPAQIPAAQSVPADIRIELRRGATVINVSWPTDAASACAAWIRELLR